MEIKNNEQYNQGVSKYKVLASNAGVGSIVATKWGGFIMPKTSSEWGFVKHITNYLEKHPEVEIDYKYFLEEIGAELIEDNRFVKFLRETENLKNLKCLVAIPHVVLNQNNCCDVRSHPINIRYKEAHPQVDGLKRDMFTIPAIVFPRWFFSKRNSHDFKPIEEWLNIWKKERCNNGEVKYFAPPRDPYLKTDKTIDKSLPNGKEKMHALLEQVSMVLICPKGHISDIPWYKYFCAYNNDKEQLYDEGFDLFNYDESLFKCPNHEHHELQWLESRNHAESFGVLKCKNCEAVASLEGIMNLHPCCPGHRPWEGPEAKEEKLCEQNGVRCTMKWAMVTSNSVYYAENFSSIYIPECYLGDANILDDEQKVISENIPNNNQSGIHDIRENYRFQEYSVFQDHKTSLDENDKLIFQDIDLDMELIPYFSKIQQVNTLGLSSTQINFSRVQMPQPQLVDGIIQYPDSMKIFKGNHEDVKVMPANQTYGEGLFFSFDNKAVVKWLSDNEGKLQQRYKISSTETFYEAIKQEMERGGVAKFYLLHTFSHLIMKEVEFSCGYPTASLCERLYFSDRMCGVLIYTADGSEGSMGGLVWQGQPLLIKKIIESALRRAQNCASDPICWENEDHINYAACFSCAMVSETSCEKRNLGLDRRALVDSEYGFFKDLLKL